MPGVPLTFRTATAQDAPAVAALVRSAYRGPESRAGWTTEADLLTDDRIDAAGVADKIAADGVVLLAVDADGRLVACCELARRGGGLAYFGMFAVSPTLQAAGLGRQVLAQAEAHARREWGTTTIEMTVIGQRSELIAWYQRRGYAVTGETRPFPYDLLRPGQALRDDLAFVVLAKQLT